MAGFRVFSGRDVLADAAAMHIVKAANRAIASRGQFALALSGGSTPRCTYRLLAHDRFASQVDWSCVHIFWGDERCVPPDHPDSNYRMAWRTSLHSLPIPEANLHRMAGEREPREAAACYAVELRRVLGDALRFDLILLGMGEDGHTASLFPGTPTVEIVDRPTTAVYVPAFDRWRLTLTLSVINAARAVCFLVQGASKAPTLARVRDGALLPAARVAPVSGDLVWFVERSTVGPV